MFSKTVSSAVIEQQIMYITKHLLIVSILQTADGNHGGAVWLDPKHDLCDSERTAHYPHERPL